MSMRLLDQLDRHAQDCPGRLAIRQMVDNRVLTYRQLSERVKEFACILRQHLPRGSTVIVRICNRAEFQIAFLAGLSARLAVFPVAPDLTEPELLSAVRQTGARAIVQADMRLVNCADNGPLIPRESALLLQSSGTTSLPKVVCRPAKSIDACAEQMCDAIRINGDDQVLTCVPLSHSYGIEHGLLMPIFRGASVHLAHGFNLDVIQKGLTCSAITVFPAVPPVFEMLAELSTHQIRPAKLRLTYSAGGHLPICVNQTFHARFGMHVAQLYGASEIGSVTFASPDSPHFSRESVGKPMAGVELKMDQDNQLLVRARSMMSGYIGDETAILPDGFFPTGDLARIDGHGNLWITGRIKLLIDVGGRKVNPLEVEQALVAHPAVGQCVVVGVRQSQTVRRLKAVLTRASAAAPSDDELRAFLRQRLSAYKIPRSFEFRDALPTSPAGKIQRHLVESE